MRRYKLITSVREMGLGARFARSRLRLITTTIAVTAAFIGYSHLTTGYMRGGSNSVGLNLVMISGAMLLIIVIAYFQALLLGDLTFPGRWRERVVLGMKIEINEDEDLRETIGKLTDYSGLFFTAFALLLFANFTLYGWVTNDFMGEYDTWGYHSTLLRSEEPDDRIRGIRKLVHPREAEASVQLQVRADLQGMLYDEDSEVQLWAIWAVGRLRVFEAAPLLSSLVRDRTQTDGVRARAAESLGVLAQDGAGERLSSLRDGILGLAGLLAQGFGNEELTLGLLRGLGLARLPETAPLIEPLTHVDPVEVRAHAFWALGRTGNREYQRELVQALGGGNDDDQCFAAEALKFIANSDDLVNAHTLFAAAPDTSCESVVWELPYHWSEGHSFRMEIVIAESLRAKFLKVVFAAAGCTERSELRIPASCIRERDFFAELSNDTGEPEAIRRLARELAVRIDYAQ